MGTSVALVVAAANPHAATAQLGRDLADAVAGALSAHGHDPAVRTIEVAAHAQDLARVQIGALPGLALAQDLRSVERAGAVIAVTQVFQGSYSGLFKMFIDALDPDALAGTPVLLAACGSSPAHTLVVDQVMRPLFGFMRALTVPTAVYLATRAPDPDAATRLSARMTAAAEELATLTHPH